MSKFLYHHTTKFNLKKIKDNNALWFVHVKKFIKDKKGDKRELRHGLNILVDLIFDYLCEKHPELKCFPNAKNILKEQINMNQVYKLTMGGKRSSALWFVGCFTRNKSNQYLNAHYSKFQDTKLRIDEKYFDKYKILDVNYCNSKEELSDAKILEAKKIAELYDWTCQPENKKDRDIWDDRFYEYLDLLIEFIFSIKRKKYSGEEEVRCIRLHVRPKTKFKKRYFYIRFLTSKTDIHFHGI